MQPRLHSLLESLTNVAIGFGIALTSQLILFAWYGVQLSMRDNINITLWMTLVSIVRSYALRRMFNRLVHHDTRQ